MKIRDPPKGRSKQEGTYITREINTHMGSKRFCTKAVI